MFVVRSRLKAQGALFSAVAMLALAACDDPVANTDLRPEGSPEVLAVLGMNDPGLFLETSTFCKLNDAKRPTVVAISTTGDVLQICDNDPTRPAGVSVVDEETGEETFTPGGVTDATPTGWYFRIMFDELLDPSVEDLVEITEDLDDDPATPETGTGVFRGSLLITQPVALSCTPPGSTTAVTVPYDGYYSPSGNSITWPLGPSLFIQPVDLSSIATGSTCTVSINSTVVDKDGVGVPADQQGNAGEYSMGIAALEFVESSPAPSDPGDEEEITADAPVVLAFNAFIDPASLAASEVTILEHATADCADPITVARTAVIGGDPASGVIEISIAGAPVVCPGAMAGDPDVACAFAPNKAYTIEFTDTNAIADVAGGPGALPGAADFSLCFLTIDP